MISSAHQGIYQIKDRGPLSFHNNHTLLRKIDSLPAGPAFRCVEIQADGDQVDEDGHSSETLEMWTRDPVECVKELMGNPAFADNMKYGPIRKWKHSKDPENHIYDKAWTAGWW